ncbi:MAG TPA: S-adenosylmethionine decarboxylase [Patescibacteria group bacterium]|nr:S-adenosylmethionine decarboxylase [Patescibacteria group bacterium]
MENHVKRYHVIVDVAGVGNKKVLHDKQHLYDFLTTLPAKIGMHILYGPVVVDGIAENPGLSGFVIIDYSHISIHTFSNGGEALVDVFSCKPYDKETLVKDVIEFLNVQESKSSIKVVSWG